MIRFPLGRVVATPGALSALEKAEQLPAEFLDRHVNGDWGEVPDADKQENEVSVEQGFRILSAYTTSAGDRIWVLTEADRSATTSCCQRNIDRKGEIVSYDTKTLAVTRKANGHRAIGSFFAFLARYCVWEASPARMR